MQPNEQRDKVEQHDRKIARLSTRYKEQREIVVRVRVETTIVVVTIANVVTKITSSLLW